MQDKRLKHIVHQLKGKTFSDDLMVEIKSDPDVVFEVLVSGINGGNFTSYQIVHSLHIIFELCSKELNGSQDTLLRLCLICVESDDDLVANQSLIVIVRMMISNNVSENYYVLDETLKIKACEVINHPKNKNLSSQTIEYVTKCNEKYSLCKK